MGAKTTVATVSTPNKAERRPSEPVKDSGDKVMAGLQSPAGLADGLEAGVPLSEAPVEAATEYAPGASIAPMGPPRRRSRRLRCILYTMHFYFDLSNSSTESHVNRFVSSCTLCACRRSR